MCDVPFLLPPLVWIQQDQRAMYSHSLASRDRANKSGLIPNSGAEYAAPGIHQVVWSTLPRDLHYLCIARHLMSGW
jgi:hypothetical protein